MVQADVTRKYALRSRASGPITPALPRGKPIDGEAWMISGSAQRRFDQVEPALSVGSQGRFAADVVSAGALGKFTTKYSLKFTAKYSLTYRLIRAHSTLPRFQAIIRLFEPTDSDPLNPNRSSPGSAGEAAKV